jgi:hypothetical protein
VRSDRPTVQRQDSDDHLQAPVQHSPSRPPSRLTAGSVVPVVLAVLAAGFAYEALQDRSSMTSIVVANSTVAAGAPIDSRDTRAVRVHSSDTALAQGLLTPSQLANGWVTTVALQTGEPVTLSEVEKPSQLPALGQMSIAVPLPQAAGGRISAGNLVDVIASNGAGGAYYVAQGLRVLGVAPTSNSSGVLGGSAGTYFVIVDVDKQVALRIAAAVGAQAGGPGGENIEVVRSSGERPTAHLRYGSPLPAGAQPPTGSSAGKLPQQKGA